MIWATHMMGGIISIGMLALLPNGVMGSDGVNNAGVLAGFAALASLLPDLDAVESKIKHLKVAGMEPFHLPAILLNQTFGHRGFLHSLAGLGVFTLLISIPVALFLGWQPGAALALGYASHLALDACTKTGIPLGFPKSRRWYLLPPPLRITTGSQSEDFVFVLLSALVLLLFLPSLLP